jgi:uncharacterized phage protein gp47/JayE
MINVSMKAMLEAGVHFGHQTRRWNPKMSRFIFGERNSIHIIDLQKTAKEIKKVAQWVSDQAAAGKKILFVGTKKQAQDIVRTEAERCGASYVCEKWLGGTLTNFATLRKSVKRLEEIEKASYLSTAQGNDLDRIGSLFGVNRIRQASARTAGFSRAVQFTNNGSLTATIPSGTRVWPPDDPDKAYFTTEGMSLAGGATALTHVRAAAEGSFFNAGLRSLTAHNAPYADVSVTNILPINNGEDFETDIAYRVRIQQEITRREGLNEDNLRALLKSLPGIRDVWLFPLYRGPGTLDIVVLPFNEESPTTFLNEVSRFLEVVLPVGISALVKLPVSRYLDLKVSVKVRTGALASPETIRSRVRAAIGGYVENLPLEDGSGNSTFYPSEAVVRIFESSEDIVDTTVQVGLDGISMSPNLPLTLDVGEHIRLRSLSVT